MKKTTLLEEKRGWRVLLKKEEERGNESVLEVLQWNIWRSKKKN
jgi:hypothetical protein